MDHVLPKLDDTPEQQGEERKEEERKGEERRGGAPVQTIGCLGSLVVGKPAGSIELRLSKVLKP